MHRWQSIALLGVGLCAAMVGCGESDSDSSNKGTSGGSGGAAVGGTGGTGATSGVGGSAGIPGSGGNAGSANGGTAGAGGSAGTPGTGGSGGVPGEDCTKYPFSSATLLAELVGFGKDTTGGDPATIFHVTQLGDSGAGSLREGLTSTQANWIVFDVEGVIELSSEIKMTSNKTVDGRGRDIEIHGYLRMPSGTKNVILSDIAVTDPGAADGDPDLIELRGGGGSDPLQFETRNFWFHHLALSHAGDGLIDVRGATNITISYGHFFDHTKAFLHMRDTNDAVVPGMRITYHHNWFDHITRRGPQFHCGLADYFNNYQDEWYEFGATSQEDAQFLSEANIYKARPGQFCIPACPDPAPHGGGNDFLVSKQAVVSGWDNDKGRIRSVADKLENEAVVEEYNPTTVFQRATYYAATPEPADEALRTKLTTETGPRKNYCKP
jgi:pectate lyase